MYIFRPGSGQKITKNNIVIGRMDEWMTQIETIVASDVKHSELNLMNRKNKKKALVHLQVFAVKFRHRIGLAGSSAVCRLMQLLIGSRKAAAECLLACGD